MNNEPAKALKAESTRQRIITAATNLFGKVGYTRATTRSIASTAGVNEVTLFRLFGSKQNLLLTIKFINAKRG